MQLATVPDGLQLVVGIALLLLAIPFTWQLIQGLRTGATHFPLSVMFPGRAERGQRRYFLVMVTNSSPRLSCGSWGWRTCRAGWGNAPPVMMSSAPKVPRTFVMLNLFQHQFSS